MSHFLSPAGGGGGGGGGGGLDLGCVTLKFIFSYFKASFIHPSTFHSPPLYILLCDD